MTVKPFVLQGIEFKLVSTASGTRNFFGQGWPHHKLLYENIPGFDFNGSTFIAKTTTINRRGGNLPLGKNYMPKDKFPDCIKVYPLRGVTLNAVGLSGPGALQLFKDDRWQAWPEPFFISFMAVGQTAEDRLDETKGFIDLLWRLRNFKSRVGIQLNVSCPNTEHKTLMMIKEALGFLSCFQKIRKTGVPIDLKIGVADASLDFIKEIEASGLADCITCSNTIKYGGMPEKINWEEFFGQKGSPLKKYGGGGLSGRPLLPIVIDWLKMVRDAGITMPIKGGGGILSLEDAKEVIGAGANAIEIGAVTILRPWRVESIINGVNKLQGKEL